MKLYRLIAPDWLCQKSPSTRRVLEGRFFPKQIKEYNAQGYNIYFLPNHPSSYASGTIDGSDIDVYNCVFVDFDTKSNTYSSKDAFIEAIGSSGLAPTRVVDSGNGIHVYWRVSDLDARSYLRLSKRLIQLYNTDDSVWTIFQLMREPGTLNTKDPNNLKPCELLYEDETVVYTCEELDKALPPITPENETACVNHYEQTFNPQVRNAVIDDTLPPKFGKLLRENHEAKAIWSGNSDDRSKDDYRLGHIMFANSFTKEEATSVLVNSAKALARAPVHRVSYATNIVDKIWTYEERGPEAANTSPSVRDILSKGEDVMKGARFPCHKLVDDTEHGFRLGQVIGIIGGSGVGKTTLTLNMFLWFAANNPDYHHFFFSLEQPVGEIASRIRTICGDNESLYDKIHIISNYDDDGSFKHLSLSTIEDHVLEFQKNTGHKVGATVIDHIGVLSKETKNGENDGLIGVCRQMKATAVRLNTMLIMLSQAPREKSGVGDIELDKSAAYGTTFFEAFVDYCLCMWQPLKRVYQSGAPTIMALKFAKIRHKKQGLDKIQEDICYQFYFDPVTERIRSLTQEEEISAKFFLSQATNLRKLDKKTDIVPYKSRRIEEDNYETEVSKSLCGTEIREVNLSASSNRKTQ